MRAIRSKRELGEARKNLIDLRKQLGMLRNVYRHDRQSLNQASRGLRELARETARAINAFERAQRADLPPMVGSLNSATGQLELPRVLRLLRLAAGLGQVELAERMHTRQASISRWEREGYDGYSLRQLQALANALGYDLDVSFRRRQEKKS